MTTRAAGRNAALALALRRAGARIVEFPAIEIAPPRSWEPLDRACRGMRKFDWIVFASANAVDAWVARCRRLRLRRMRGTGPRVAVVGPATASRAASAGWTPDRVATDTRAEGLVALFDRIDLRGKRVLIPRSDRGRDLVARRLAARGARVTEVCAYRTRRARPTAASIRALLARPRLDVVVLASGETARHFVGLLGRKRAAGLLNRVSLAAIGPETARVIRSLGWRASILPGRSTIPDLVRACVAHFRGEPS